MANIETKFYFARCYVVRKSNMLGDGVVYGSIYDDTEAGKVEAERRCEELQKQNDAEIASVKKEKKK